LSKGRIGHDPLRMALDYLAEPTHLDVLNMHAALISTEPASLSHGRGQRYR